MVTKKKEVEVTIPQIEVGRFEVTIIGTTPLMQNNFKEKMLELASQRAKGGVKVRKHEPVKPEERFNAGRYRLNHGDDSDGFKANSIKLACLRVASISGVFKTQLSGSLYILPNDFDADGNGLIRILDPETWKPKVPEMNFAMGRTTTGAPVECYRPLYWPWGAKFEVEYMADVIQPEQIINLINRAGFASGIGEERPSAPKKPGEKGRFQVVTSAK